MYSSQRLFRLQQTMVSILSVIVNDSIRLHDGQIESFKEESEMSNQEIFDKAKQIIGKCPFPAFTTIDENGFPQSRAMMVSGLDDDHTLYYITSRTSAKCSQIEANPNVSTLWTSVVEPMRDWGSVLIKGKASITDDKALRDRFWMDQLTFVFPGGADDPNYVIIVVKPVELDLADNTMMFPTRLKL